MFTKNSMFNMGSLRQTAGATEGVSGKRMGDRTSGSGMQGRLLSILQALDELAPEHQPPGQRKAFNLGVQIETEELRGMRGEARPWDWVLQMTGASTLVSLAGKVRKENKARV